MRRRAALALVPLALGACGTGPTATDATSSPATVTPESLSEALLTASDLGSGWTETQRDVFTDREPENPSIDPSLWCPAGQGDELVLLAGRAGADVELTTGPTGAQYFVRQQAWSNAQVGQYLTAVQQAVTACSGVTWVDDGGNSYTLQPRTTVPQIGDESVSWTVTIQLSGASTVTSFTDQTAGRFGPVMMVLQAGATPVASPEASAPNYVLLARSASDKMAGHVSG